MCLAFSVFDTSFYEWQLFKSFFRENPITEVQPTRDELMD